MDLNNFPSKTSFYFSFISFPSLHEINSKIYNNIHYTIYNIGKISSARFSSVCPLANFWITFSRNIPKEESFIIIVKYLCECCKKGNNSMNGLFTSISLFILSSFIFIIKYSCRCLRERNSRLDSVCGASVYVGPTS